MRNRVTLLFCALALVSAGCQKQDQEPVNEHGTPNYNDADYLMDGLFRQVNEEYVPICGFFRPMPPRSKTESASSGA